MSTGITAEVVFSLIGIGTIIGSYVAGKSALTQRSTEIKNDLLQAYDSENKKLKESIEEIRQGAQDRDDQQQKLIDKLRAEVDTWKNLPIKSLAESNAKLTALMSDMASRNHELLQDIAQAMDKLTVMPVRKKRG